MSPHIDLPAAEDLLVKSIVRTCRAALLALPLMATGALAQSPSLTIEKLITDGWEVAGLHRGMGKSVAHTVQAQRTQVSRAVLRAG